MTVNGVKSQTKDEVDDEIFPMQKMEDALVICKFGRFHLYLLFTTLISVFATTSVTTTTSYILPSAECDLNMTMMQKGILNAIPFLGQVCAALFTGFIIDAFGRKVFLVGGNFGICICALFGASSQNYAMLLFGKLMEGVIMSLCFTATASMVTEFTSRDVRDRVMLLYSSFMSISLIGSALLAWGVLPRPWNFIIAEGYFEIHSWNVYLYVNAAWSLLAAILYWKLPESPKFLLSHGQENEALDVLKTIYKINTGKEKESFPITSLNVSGIYTPTAKISFKKQTTDALFEVKELFRFPLVLRLFLFSILTFVCLLAYSALRLWYPQLSTMIENYESEHPGQTTRFCVIVDSYTFSNETNVLNVSSMNIEETVEQCIPKLPGQETYTNGMILGLGSLLCIGLSAYLVAFFGQKLLMFVFLILCTICSVSLYWSESSIQIAILVSATCAFMQTAFSLQHSILVRVFPTTVRTMALSLVIMFGRIGSLLGNLLFPMMLQNSCMTPFITLSAITLSVAGLVYFLPNPKSENNGQGDK